MDHLLTKRITDTMHMQLKCMLMLVMMHTQKKRTMLMLKLVMMPMLKKRTMLMRMHTEQRLTMHMQNTFITNNKTALGVPYM
jgi:hypothetical protein